jgi:hypothetical protein
VVAPELLRGGAAADGADELMNQRLIGLMGESDALCHDNAPRKRMDGDAEA